MQPHAYHLKCTLVFCTLEHSTYAHCSDVWCWPASRHSVNPRPHPSAAPAVICPPSTHTPPWSLYACPCPARCPAVPHLAQAWYRPATGRGTMRTSRPARGRAWCSPSGQSTPRGSCCHTPGTTPAALSLRHDAARVRVHPPDDHCNTLSSDAGHCVGRAPNASATGYRQPGHEPKHHAV
jgi:hypothetical protein